MRPLFSLSILALALTQGALRAQFIERGPSFEEETVLASTQVLKEIMAIPAKGIPETLLADAHGVAVVPGLIKGGFIVGVRHGRGVVVTKDATGAWRSPAFITVTGGSVGFQGGLQATDVILVFKTPRSVDGLLRGKFTIGADAAVAAGPVGRQASAATDAQLKAEILSYSRSRGLFAGVAIDGAALQIDNRAGAVYYAPRPGQPQNAIPASALQLLETVAQYAGPAPKVVPLPAPVAQQEPFRLSEREAVRQQLAKSSLELHALLDPRWQQYLALPMEVYSGPTSPGADKLTGSLQRYGAVAADPRYRSLTERREFQETQALLQRLLNLPAAADGVLKLPPPPK
jgi:lipid-binding SYLF domain-containing protein